MVSHPALGSAPPKSTLHKADWLLSSSASILKGAQVPSQLRAAKLLYTHFTVNVWAAELQARVLLEMCCRIWRSGLTKCACSVRAG